MDGTRANKALESLFELAVLLVDSMEGGWHELRLTRARAELMWRLVQQGPMTQQALSQALRCTPRNVTGLVDALQSAGLVTREAHPTDRRATLVHLTRQGMSAAAAWQAHYQRVARQIFSDLNATDLAQLAAILDHVLAQLREGATRPSATAPAEAH
jgi:DNA-binding MarR family transcriptional regulator